MFWIILNVDLKIFVFLWNFHYNSWAFLLDKEVGQTGNKPFWGEGLCVGQPYFHSSQSERKQWDHGYQPWPVSPVINQMLVSLLWLISPFSTRFLSQFVPLTNPLQCFLSYRLCCGRETITDFSHAAAGGWWPWPTCLCFKCKFIVNG